jgi:chromosome segregation ATPase
MKTVKLRISEIGKGRPSKPEEIIISLKEYKQLQAQIFDLTAKLNNMTELYVNERELKKQYKAENEKLKKDKDFLEEVETDLSNTIGFMERGIDIWKAEAEQLQAENEKLRKRIFQYEEAEAMVCPEDVGVKEYVEQLRLIIEKALPWINNKNSTCSTECLGQCAACTLKTRIRKALKGGE